MRLGEVQEFWFMGQVANSLELALDMRCIEIVNGV